MSLRNGFHLSEITKDNEPANEKKTIFLFIHKYNLFLRRCSIYLSTKQDLIQL